MSGYSPGVTQTIFSSCNVVLVPCTVLLCNVYAMFFFVCLALFVHHLRNDFSAMHCYFVKNLHKPTVLYQVVKIKGRRNICLPVDFLFVLLGYYLT